MSMIDQMAQAMWDWEMQTQMFRMFDDESDDTKRMFRSRARAALTALLEPTEAMTVAGDDVEMFGVSVLRIGESHTVFCTMIQTALDGR